MPEQRARTLGQKFCQTLGRPAVEKLFLFFKRSRSADFPDEGGEMLNLFLQAFWTAAPGHVAEVGEVSQLVRWPKNDRDFIGKYSSSHPGQFFRHGVQVDYQVAERSLCCLTQCFRQKMFVLWKYLLAETIDLVVVPR